MDDEACRAAYGDINGDGTVDENDGCLVDGVNVSQLQASVTNIADTYVKTEDTTNWDKDASDDVTDDDTTNWDKDYTDDVTQSTTFSGDVSGTYSSLQLGSGVVETGNMASTNISQWSNDSGYITDGNTGWDNEYNFITDGNTNWNNDYGFITDGNTNWGNEYGFITKTEADSAYAAAGHDHDSAYVNVSGDTMTGDLTIPYGGVNWDVAETLSDHETRIAALEIYDPAQTTAFAYGTMNGSSVVNTYGMSSTVSLDTTTGICASRGVLCTYNEYTLSFSSPRSSDDYILSITPDHNIESVQVSKSSSGFTIQLYAHGAHESGNSPPASTTGSFDFVIFAP